MGYESETVDTMLEVRWDTRVNGFNKGTGVEDHDIYYIIILVQLQIWQLQWVAGLGMAEYRIWKFGDGGLGDFHLGLEKPGPLVLFF